MKREHYLLIAGAAFLLFGFLFAALSCYCVIPNRNAYGKMQDVLASRYVIICIVMEIIAVASIAFGIKYTKKT